MKQLLLLLIALLVLKEQLSAKGYTIHIAVAGLPGESRILLKDFESNTTIQETVLKEGKGVLQGSLQQGPRLLFVTILAGNATYWCNFMIDNEEVWLHATVHDFPYSVRVTGSPTQDLFYSLNVLLAADRMRRDSLLVQGKKMMADTSLRNELRRVVKQMTSIDSTEIVIKKNFIEKNVQTHLAVMELFLLKSSYEKSILAGLYARLTDSLKSSVYGKKIRDFLGIARIVEKGDQAYVFTATDQQGRKHIFPQKNGQYLLLDFTKNHCLPCVESVGELKTIYRQYENQLTIVSFSPDEEKSWLQSIRRDRPTWLYLHDGKGSTGPVVMNYGVEAYPTFFLIDPAGIVLAKWSGYSTNGITNMVRTFLERKQ